ncbi:FecCD family ABC transporter permease [Acidaminococcus timonensis]|uniref:FecCD family ABC transporter permease n=1 Tax=Acidaminococcus timonensis TaxID=1871002 RepID=UPI0008D98222|nr:iron ABC transporter permease [Acidaminococcus timonensis]
MRKGKLLGILLVALVPVCLMALVTGQVPVSLPHLLTGGLTPLEQNVVWNLRLPRLLLGLGTGAALAASGAALQGLFGNPLADPGILGVSGGASLGAVILLLTGLPARQYLFLPLGAFAGAALASLLVGILGRSENDREPVRLLLAGVAVSLFCGALTAGLLSFAPDAIMRQYFFWTLGNLGVGTWQQAAVLLPLLLVVLLVLCLWGRPLNLLSLGEEQALALGLDAPRWRKQVLGWVSLLMGLAVCAGGNIGFVGLIIPHMLRLLTGPDHRSLLPLSALGGALFLVLCDSLGRALLPGGEIRVGIVTALFGAPYFLWLLRRRG